MGTWESLRENEERPRVRTAHSYGQFGWTCPIIIPDHLPLTPCDFPWPVGDEACTTMAPWLAPLWRPMRRARRISRSVPCLAFVAGASEGPDISGMKTDIRNGSHPTGSMYGIYGNIWGILMVNVTIYGIHGSYGHGCCLCSHHRFPMFSLLYTSVLVVISHLFFKALNVFKWFLRKLRMYYMNQHCFAFCISIRFRIDHSRCEMMWAMNFPGWWFHFFWG